GHDGIDDGFHKRRKMLVDGVHPDEVALRHGPWAAEENESDEEPRACIAGPAHGTAKHGARKHLVDHDGDDRQNEERHDTADARDQTLKKIDDGVQHRPSSRKSGPDGVRQGRAASLNYSAAALSSRPRSRRNSLRSSTPRAASSFSSA